MVLHGETTTRVNDWFAGEPMPLFAEIVIG
jgi:hypothetical protein